MKKTLLFLFAISIGLIATAQLKRTDANIIGHVVSRGEHIPFATVMLKGTTIGVSTDETGHYQMVNMPEGNFTLRVQVIGFKAQEKDVTLIKGKTVEVNFDLEPDVLGLDAVVVTANRNEKNRKNAPVIVNTISAKLFETTQAVALSESLNFSPGVRLESNCSNCGFTQVRMNGMEGAYSQVLINNRPIFSGLAGVYGLELIPSTMIERIEVVRGGGSALYGANAIAGTINLILKDPINNSYEVGVNQGFTGVGRKEGGDLAGDYSMNFNTSIVSNDTKTGMSLYGFYRDRDAYDANGDDFSELTQLKNITVGTRVFHRFSTRSKLAADFFSINEKRRGGNKFDMVEHMADIAESLGHNITSGALTYEQYLRDSDKLTVFASGQYVDRDAYYGAGRSISDYGSTQGFTFNGGAQYYMEFGISNLTMGLEDRAEWLVDTKLGYPDINNPIIHTDAAGNQTVEIPYVENTLISDQYVNTVGAYAQYDLTYNKFNLSLGARFDNFVVEDRDHDEKMTGNVLSPRVTVKYDILESLQARASYSQGYRAPQVFDEDLHISASQGRKIIHQNSSNLKKETSHSFMASLDFNKKLGSVFTGLLVEGFYTQLNDAFMSEVIGPDEDGLIINKRINAEGGAFVKGVNMELNLVPHKDFTFTSGFTFQNSMYEDEQDFNEKHFFRTPDTYGFVAIDWDVDKFCFSASGSYTGKMLVPYYGVIENAAGELEDNISLKESGSFFDLGLKARYTTRLSSAKIQFFVGVKNLFDSYQKDHDLGENKDPAYIYGPSSPRTVYGGIKIGNMLE